jgi:hypothetical protein
MVWITVHGVHLLSDAMMDNVFPRLAESWRMLLPAIVPADSLPYFSQFLARTAAQFESVTADHHDDPKNVVNLFNEETG